MPMTDPDSRVTSIDPPIRANQPALGRVLMAGNASGRWTRQWTNDTTSMTRAKINNSRSIQSTTVSTKSGAAMAIPSSLGAVRRCRVDGTGDHASSLLGSARTRALGGLVGHRRQRRLRVLRVLLDHRGGLDLLGILDLHLGGGELRLGLLGTGTGDDPLAAGDQLGVDREGTLLGDLGATDDDLGVAQRGVAQLVDLGTQGAL